MAQTFAEAVFNGEKWNDVRDMEIVVTEGVDIMKRIYNYLAKLVGGQTVEEIIDLIYELLKRPRIM